MSSIRVLVGLVLGVALLVSGCGRPPLRERDELREVPGLTGIVAVDAAGDHSLALTADGRVFTWGDAGGGIGGPAPYENCANRTPGTTPTACRPTPVVVPVPARVPELPPVVAVDLDLGRGVALDREGRVWQWGTVGREVATATCLGGLGFDDAFPCAPTPQVVVGLPHITAVAMGPGSTVALADDGGVWVWGWGWRNEAAGVGTVPLRLALPPITAMTSGEDDLAYVAQDGSVWSVGQRPVGVPADNCYTGCNVDPLQELPPGTAVGIAGPSGVGVRTADGRVLVKGHRQWLGNAGPAPTWTPAAPLDGTVSLAAGDHHDLVLRGDGRVLAVGYNAYGQLGL